MAAKPTRSPVLGFNHNVKYRGRIFHVQTEDSGPVNPRIFTHLYFGGTILATKKHEYDPAAPEDVVRSLMQSQHKSILKELKGAKHDDRVERFFAARGETLEAAAPAPAHVEALDLDAAPAGRPGATPVTPAPVVFDTPPPVVFADTFEDEPTTPDHGLSLQAPPASADKTQETPIPDLPSALGTPPPLPAAVAARRRPARVTPPLGTSSAQVVVQRTVAVGGNTSGASAGHTGAFGRVIPRGRKPAPAIPYVVKEGTHPLADARADLPVSAALPAARPMTPPPVTAQNASLTSSLPPRRVGPGSEPVVEKSLDEVILAYLAQGGESETR
jgi:hypothetical protein